jgi:hypothetical protein
MLENLEVQMHLEDGVPTDKWRFAGGNDLHSDSAKPES